MIGMCACFTSGFCLTCTIAAMSIGSMARGKRRMLNREMEVKAFSAVNTLSELTPTNTANVARDTCRKGRRKDSVSEKIQLRTVVFVKLL